MFTAPLSLSEETVMSIFAMRSMESPIYVNFNLVSDICVSVNAFYSPAIDQKIGNYMSMIGILTEDSDGVCQQIEVDS